LGTHRESLGGLASQASPPKDYTRVEKHTHDVFVYLIEHSAQELLVNTLVNWGVEGLCKRALNVELCIS
jgi:hypothetical protein